MYKHWLVWYAISGWSLFAAAQESPTSTPAEVLKHYSQAERRLLVESTVHAINLTSQHNLDQDSITLIACKADSLPFLTPYGEVLDDQFSPGAGLINTGRISEAINTAASLQGDDQVRLLLELTIFYLHQPGEHTQDLDSASHFLQQATQISASSPLSHWQKNCALIQGELEYQLHQVQKAKNTMVRLIAIARRDGDFKTQAIAYRQLNSYSPFNDSIQLRYCDTALGLYQSVGSREGEINMLWTLAILHFFRDIKPATECMLRVMELQKAIGFRHTLYSQFFLALINLLDKDYVTGMKISTEGLENMRWSGITAVQSLFYMRMGNANSYFWDKPAEAIAWFRKGVDVRTAETHVFWYRSFIFLAGWLMYTDRPAESLDILQRITGEYPPLTVWEQLQVVSTKGDCYRKLGDYAKADKYYSAFLALSNKFPKVDPWGELQESFLFAAEFYIAYHEPQKAQLFINCMGNYRQFTTFKITKILEFFYDYQYKLDSAEGKYAAALKDHILYQRYHDSSVDMEQTRQLDELNLQYTTEKKDQDIRLLQQQALVRQTQLQRQDFTRNITFAGIAVLLIILLLLYRQYKIKTRANRAINRQNESLNRLVGEKEWLVREVHHRVKNNLQTIMSLLELPADSMRIDPLSAIQASQNRIFATSLLHQKLYQGDNMSSVNMGVYIPELVHYLREVFETGRRIELKTSVEQIELDISLAVPIGIIVNEVVTNAIKHAFPSRPENATIRISLNMIDGNLALLKIADNGTGIPPEFVGRKTGLGLRLVTELTKDIEGVVEVSSGPGFTVTVRFTPRPLLVQATV
jgi:two-component sensor histidine kinase/tetratricopeptide (TPR) repeat protein